MKKDKGFLGEFGSAVMQIAEEKGLDRAQVFAVVEAALAAAYKKEYGKRGQNIRAAFDEKTGDVAFFLIKEVVDETTRDFTVPIDGEESVVEENVHDAEDGVVRLPRYNEERDLPFAEARAIKTDAVVGDVLEFPLPEQTEFGRVAAQTAKQVVIQRIREAERGAMFTEYKGREHEAVSATVQRVEGRTVFVDLGKSVAAMYPADQMRGEHYTVGMRMKVYIVEVSDDPKGPGIVVSRSHAELVRRLFELEVPEVFTGTVEIKSIAREAGSRTKIAVYTDEEGVDPIGSCVGQRGTRVQTVIDELGGEKMDIIEWSEDPVQFITAALSPAKVVSVTLDHDKKTAVAIVPDDQLSLAIGKRGQNVRLAVKLTGWNIDVVSTAAEAKVATSTTDTDQSVADAHDVAENDTQQSVAEEEVEEDVHA